MDFVSDQNLVQQKLLFDLHKSSVNFSTDNFLKIIDLKERISELEKRIEVLEQPENCEFWEGRNGTVPVEDCWYS